MIWPSVLDAELEYWTLLQYSGSTYIEAYMPPLVWAYEKCSWEGIPTVQSNVQSDRFRSSVTRCSLT